MCEKKDRFGLNPNPNSKQLGDCSSGYIDLFSEGSSKETKSEKF